MKRMILAALAGLLLSGCTAMMLSGGGGYEPPPEDCSDNDGSGRRCPS